MSFIELRRGDNDKKQIWGGRPLMQAPAYTVTTLQNALKAVGVYDGKVDGDFGKTTERALKTYQWCIKNAVRVVKNGAPMAHAPTPSVLVSGRCDLSTNSLLSQWVDNAYVVTGDLVRVDTACLSNLELGTGFVHIGKHIVTKSEFVVSKGAYRMIACMNTLARKLNIVVKINQAFRIHGTSVAGAVVSPAAKSQHLIGHAVDCNIVDGTSWNTASDFKNKKQTAKANEFIKGMKKNGYRWGGDFANVDTPHFDFPLIASSFDYDVKIFLNQKQMEFGGCIEKQLVTP